MLKRRTNKKISPNLPEEKIRYRPFYGSFCNTSGKALDKKTNLICRVKGCGYSSRVFIWTFKNSEEYCASYTCPIHNKPLLDVGCACKIPPKGKDRDGLIERFLTNDPTLNKPI